MQFQSWIYAHMDQVVESLRALEQGGAPSSLPSTSALVEIALGGGGRHSLHLLSEFFCCPKMKQKRETQPKIVFLSW